MLLTHHPHFISQIELKTVALPPNDSHSEVDLAG